MEISTNIIEAILFAAGNAVPTDLLREKLDLTKAQMDSMVRQLEKKYSGNCGIRLLIFNHKIQLATNPDYKDQVGAVLNLIGKICMAIGISIPAYDYCRSKKTAWRVIFWIALAVYVFGCVFGLIHG